MNPQFKKKSTARLIAVQTLFLVQIRNIDISDASHQCLEFHKDVEFDEILATDLIDYWDKNATHVDNIITDHLKASWSINRLDPVLLAILRTGVADIILHPSIDIPLLLTEYIDIGHAFFAQKEPQFVHGILHAAAAFIRQKKEG